MANEENVITNLLDRYEAFKLKWLQINEQDMFDFLKLQDEIDDKIIELKSKYVKGNEGLRLKEKIYRCNSKSNLWWWVLWERIRLNSYESNIWKPNQ